MDGTPERGVRGAAAALASDQPWVASDQPWVLTVEPLERREVFIEILSVWDTSRVVTVIEVLSPGNKTTGSEGRQLYVTKQQEILQSPTHLIEIDLLQCRVERTTGVQGRLRVARPKADLPATASINARKLSI